MTAPDGSGRRRSAAPVSAWRVAALLTLAVACWLSLTPKPPQPSGLPDRADLLAHLAMHGGLSFTLARGFPVLGSALSAALAVGLEVGQLGVAGRTFSVADMAANALGVLAGLAVARLSARRRR